ncbi:MAG: transferrin-binding protein-like solute binding protein [Alphaproteobacteria bacterium]|nr:transferrin-binding protein-like solute binding protein [Alphaproteobacteria bacterium]
MKQTSHATSHKVIFLLTALALGACSGGGGGSGSTTTGGSSGGSSGGSGDIGAVGVTGTGTSTDPWTMPTENETGLTKTLKDYLADGGYWQFIFDGATVTASGTAATFGTTAVYDTVNDTWTITVDGVDQILTGPMVYGNYGSCGPAPCMEMHIFDAGSTVAQYGTFGNVSASTTSGTNQLFFHTGLNTPVANLPGSATYTGYFEGTSTAALGYTVDNSVSMTADFGAGIFTFSSAGTVIDYTGTLANYTLDSTSVTISGNSYNGAMTGSLTLVGGTTDSTYTGSIEGAFYGPAAEQTAGAVVVENGTGERIQGGFWGIIP